MFYFNNQEIYFILFQILPFICVTLILDAGGKRVCLTSNKLLLALLLSSALKVVRDRN